MSLQEGRQMSMRRQNPSRADEGGKTRELATFR